MADDLYKTDLSFKSDMQVKPSGDLDLISGLDNVKESLFRRLITSEGSILHRPGYGVGIKNWQGALNSLQNQRELALAIKEQFEQDPRVEKLLGVSITSSDAQPDLVKVLIRVQIVGYGEQQFSYIPFGDTV